MEHSLARKIVVNGTVSELGNQVVHQQQAFGSAEGPFLRLHKGGPLYSRY
jgi:hypothetical protein